ncbi:hypothetical protein PXK58_08885 [Phaeobacter gallaeciensis]|uniref:phage adaptor protein n=1 Tax=Phaeobacter gallaeciensis TaxID=60890 RepID=UPI002380A009|nr:hypothetical protein [Phaeobacter gallaeciensis]MDE4274760.1 hypothetical protein [Phaeobacter gallaeciensis]MDE4299666.1 hypothetical protein [Phaeobacter gallaeciensis]MDE5184831.1 hypothetical protein [Phaeobacter gallaeciensis]
MSKTALQIAQDVALRIGQSVPSLLFGSDARTESELRSAMIEAAAKIVHAHDWAVLKTIKTNAGDGSTTEYALPSDYLRMPKDGQVWSTKWQAPLEAIYPEAWLGLDVMDFDAVCGVWTIYGGNVVYRPALAADENAKFWYVSENAVLDSGSTAKAEFTADDDTFRLDDRTLYLMTIAEWRRAKGLDYAEEMRDADTALAQAIDRDKGARILRQGSRRAMSAKIAYPFEVTP